MSGGVVQVLARVPVLGYCLKVVHDLVKLPVLRADLHGESVALAARLDRVGGEVESHASRLRIQDGRLSGLSESVARNQRSALATLTGQIEQIQAASAASHKAQTERQEAFMATLSERLKPLEARDAAIREQFDTLLQRVSDNMAEWAELRLRLLAIEKESAARDHNAAERLDQASARLDDLQTKLEEGAVNRQTVLARADDTTVKLQELHAQVNSQEDAFAGVLRQHARALASLREIIAGTDGETCRPAGGVTQLLDLFRDVLSARRPAETVTSSRQPAIEALADLPRNLQPAVRLLLGDAAPGGRFCFRVAAAATRDTDVIADFSELPFAPASIAGIRAGDLLENCSAKEARRFLAHWSTLVWSGGMLHLTFTDLEAAERTYAHVSSAFGELTRAILGQRGERRKTLNRELLHTLLREFGFQGVTEQPAKDQAAHGFRYEIHATRAGVQPLPQSDPTVMSV